MNHSPTFDLLPRLVLLCFGCVAFIVLQPTIRSQDGRMAGMKGLEQTIAVSPMRRVDD